jgi:hypothetical protein
LLLVIEATLPGYNTATWEDPEIWKSGKKYYCSVNNYASKKAIYINGRLVARMSNVMISGGGFALNHKNPGSRLSSRAYLVGIRYGKRQLQGRFTIP